MTHASQYQYDLAVTPQASRRDYVWLGALPAIVLGCAIAGTTAWASTESNREKEVRYQALAKQAARENKHDVATMCYERLLQLGRPTADLMFGMARSLDAQGQTIRAAAMMNDIAPLDRRGYPPAHFWMARQLISVPRPTPQTWQAAETHLLRALEGQLDEADDANLLLGELYLSSGQLEKARTYLEKVTNSPIAQLRLIQIASTKEDTALLKTKSEEIVRFFQTKVEREPLSETARLYWAESVTVLKDYERALAILREGRAKIPNSERIRRATTTTYLMWLDALDRDSKATPANRLAVLGRALTDDPSDVNLLRRLWGLASAKGPEGEQATAILRQQLAEGKNVGMAHLALGTIAWQSGRIDEGRMHLEQAYKIGPHVAAVANNLAWVLAYSEPPQYERALEIIGRVVDTYPKEPQFRGTRGRILAKMKRWKDAIPDLEANLAAIPDGPELHAILADAYSQLGDKVLSSLHRTWKSERGKDPERANPGQRSSP
ncbi:MAG: tetratricopeptide repeat protein [Gemmataceae bacterium]